MEAPGHLSLTKWERITSLDMGLPDGHHCCCLQGKAYNAGRPEILVFKVRENGVSSLVQRHNEDNPGGSRSGGIEAYTAATSRPGSK